MEYSTDTKHHVFKGVSPGQKALLHGEPFFPFIFVNPLFNDSG